MRRYQHRIILSLQWQQAAAQKHACTQAQRLKALATLRRAVVLRGMAVVIHGVLRVVIGRVLTAALRHPVSLFDEQQFVAYGRALAPQRQQRCLPRALQRTGQAHADGGQPAPRLARLPAALIVERYVCLSLQALFGVPGRLSMAQKINRHSHRHILSRVGRFGKIRVRRFAAAVLFSCESDKKALYPPNHARTLAPPPRALAISSPPPQASHSTRQMFRPRPRCPWLSGPSPR